MAYISRLLGAFIGLSLNGADSAEWFMNNPGLGEIGEMIAVVGCMTPANHARARQVA